MTDQAVDRRNPAQSTVAITLIPAPCVPRSQGHFCIAYAPGRLYRHHLALTEWREAALGLRQLVQISTAQVAHPRDGLTESSRVARLLLHSPVSGPLPAWTRRP